MAEFHLPDQILKKIASNNVISQVDVASAEEAISKGNLEKSLEQVLIEDYGYDRHIIYLEFCRIYAFRHVPIDPKNLDESWLQFIQDFFKKMPEHIQEKMVRKKVLPFGYSESNPNSVIFITPFPLDRQIDAILLSAGMQKYEIAYSNMEHIQRVIDMAISIENEFLQYFEQAKDTISIEEEDNDEDEVDEDELAASLNQSVLVNLFEGCLVEAVRRKSSDIHIIPEKDSSIAIYLRVDGRLVIWNKLDNTKPEAFLAVVKDRTKNVDRFEFEMAQDGFIQRTIDNYLIRFRVSILPIVSSAFTRKFESVVIRILDDRKVIKDLSKLGLNDYAQQQFVKAIKKPQGMVILTGPTGSGKSTTLVAALHYVMTPELNILTVEDPVEYNIEGARQLKIGYKMNFDQAIRSILRHDPDIVMVGEIRDPETAEIAIKLANTGHLTFSTLHTNDAVSVVSRLYKMGIEVFLIANAINLVVAQRLIRRICNHCKKEIKHIDANIVEALGLEKLQGNPTFYQPVGCDKCRKGYSGRMGIHEVLSFTPEIRSIILDSSSELNEEAIKTSAIRDGMKTLRESALAVAMRGETSLDEVIAVTMD